MRQSAALRGYDRAWRKLASAHLDAHPFCALCDAEQRLTAAACVDHKRPFRGKDDPLRLDPENLQSLCGPCHSRKTAREDGGFGRRAKGNP